MNKNLKLALPILFISLLFSCNESSNKKTESTDTKVEPELFLPNYPTSNNVFRFKILESASYYDDNLDERERMILTTPTLNKWVGLFKNGEKFYLEETVLENDQIYNSDVEMMTYNLFSNNKDSLIFCLHEDPEPSLKSKEINKAMFNKIIELNQTLNFDYGDRKYVLSTAGTRVDDGGTKNYSLILTTEDENPKKYILLSDSYRSSDVQNTPIIFAGDLDNDTKCDFVIDSSTHYNSNVLTLYLSSENYNIAAMKEKHGM